MVLESQEFESYVDAIAIPLLKLHNNTQIRHLEKYIELLNFQKFSQFQVDIVSFRNAHNIIIYLKFSIIFVEFPKLVPFSAWNWNGLN